MTFFQAEMNKAQEAIQRVRELHKEFAGNISGELELCDICHDANGEALNYPCPTIKALDGEIGSVEPVKLEALDGEQG